MRSFLIRVPEDAELLDFTRSFALENNITKAVVLGIGSFKHTVLGYYDLAAEKYTEIEVSEPVELVSLTGNITLLDGKPFPHLHAVVARRDGSTLGGHLVKATVLLVELYIQELPGPTLERKPWKYGLKAWTEDMNANENPYHLNARSRQ